MCTHLTFHSLNAQKGAALVVSMVMLLVITVIGVAVMGGSRLEWLMANNSHLQTDAYRNAEIALTQGLSPSSIPNPPILPITTPINTPPTQDLVDISKWSDGTITSISVTTPTGSGSYALQFLGCSRYDPTTSPPLNYVDASCSPTTSLVVTYNYRVWALGIDGNGAARLLQATRTLINNQVIPTYSGLPGIKPTGEFPSFDNRVELPSS